MIQIIADDILSHTPAIREYSGYERETTIFDDYITRAEKEIRRLMDIENIDVDSVELENDLNLKEVILCFIIYSYYSETSYNTEEDRYFIEKLEKCYKDNYNIFVNTQKNDDDPFSLNLNFVG